MRARIHAHLDGTAGRAGDVPDTPAQPQRAHGTGRVSDADDLGAFHHRLRAYNGRDSEQAARAERLGLLNDADEFRRADMPAVHTDMVRAFGSRDNARRPHAQKIIRRAARYFISAKQRAHRSMNGTPRL